MASFNQIIDSVVAASRTYKSRFIPDAGLMRSDNITKAFTAMAIQNESQNSIQFAWFGESASKFRTSGVYNYFTKLYSAKGTNDGVQTTELSQPYLSGNIAPNERYCLNNSNFNNRYVTHPNISFTASDTWSVTFAINLNGTNQTGNNANGIYFDGLTNYGSSVTINNNGNITISNQAGGYVFTTLKIPFGKINIISIVADGLGNINIYQNGVLNSTKILSSAVTFARIGYSHAATNFGRFEGKYYAHIIRSGALTQTQVTNEYNFFRSIYPEVETVKIGTQDWATSNLDVVATPQGNVISNVTENVNVEKITGGNFESGLVATIGLGNEIATWTLNTTTPISGTQDGLLQVTTVGTNPIRPRLYFTTSATTVGNWSKLSFNYKVNSGTCVLYSLTDGAEAFTINQTLTGSGTFTRYIKNWNTGLFIFYFNGKSLFNVQIDNVSVQQVGWAGSTELYDGIYNQTTGTVEQKTYAAVKAAAMWSYYNNDAALGAIYGKLYNWYAAKLLQMDIDYYNAANPTTPWGYKVPALSDWNTLATTLGGSVIAGGKMKVDGTVYWFTGNTGTNSSGLTLLPGGYRNYGSFVELLKEAYILSIDASIGEEFFGMSIRLLKN